MWEIGGCFAVAGGGGRDELQRGWRNLLRVMEKSISWLRWWFLW